MSEGTLAAGAAVAENPAPAPNAGPAPAPAASPSPAPAAADPAATPAPATEPAPKGPWGDDWRERLAGEDAKRLERLKRFADPSAVLTAYEEAQRKISEGLKPKGKPGEKATDDEWKAYRAEAGIPETVEDFVKAIKLPDNRVIGEADLPVVNAFAERAIKKGVAPGDLAELVDEYYSMQEEVANRQAEEDGKFKTESMKALKSEWGGDYDGNMAAMRPYFDTVDPELFNNLFDGRLADGTKIGNHPAILRFFANKAVAENPMATVFTPGNTAMQSLDGEIAGFEKRMREDRDAWFKDTKAQSRYQQLIDARDKVAAKK